MTGVRYNAPERVRNALTAGAELRDAYDAGTVRGTFLIELATPRTVRALAIAGFDFVVLDLEHSSYGFDTLSGLIAEAHAAGIPALVRPWALDDGLIAKVLDAGANGVLLPRVDSVEQARRAVLAARYAPLGTRGVCPLIGYSVAPSRRELGDSVLVVVQLEGHDGIEQAHDIAAVDGLDGIFIGPYDLAQSLGHAEQPTHPDVVAAARRVADVVEGRTMLGVYMDDAHDSPAWSEAGFRLQCIGFDGRMLLNAARDVLKDTGSTL